MVWFTYLILKRDGVSTWFKEAESTIKDVWINQLRDQIVDQLHSNLLLCVLTEKFWVGVFEDDFDLHADSQNNHRHVEGHEYTLACILCLKLSLNLSDWDEQLFAMVHVKWKLVELTKDAPVGQMSDETNQTRSSWICYLGSQDVYNGFLTKRWSFFQCQILLLCFDLIKADISIF